LDTIFLKAVVSKGAFLHIDAFDLVAEYFLEVLLISDEGVDMGKEGLVGLDGLLACPEFRAEIEVVGDDRAGGVGGADGVGGDLAGGVGEGGEDAAGVEPAGGVSLKSLGQLKSEGWRPAVAEWARS